MGHRGRTTTHGFRSTASTILHENSFNTNMIEIQLSHSDRNEVRASYNFAKYLPARHEMMQWWSGGVVEWWSDYIERALKSGGGNVIDMLILRNYSIA